MNRITTYGKTMTLGEWTISTDGHSSMLNAETECFRRGLEKGWRPSPLRGRRWQFWRPKEYPAALIEALKTLDEE